MDRRNFYSKCERALLLSHFIQSGTLAAIKICLLAMFDDETIEYKYIEAAINLVYAIGKPKKLKRIKVVNNTTEKLEEQFQNLGILMISMMADRQGMIAGSNDGQWL